MFWTRLCSGIILVIIALLTMSIGGTLLLGVLLCISLIAYRELTKALQGELGSQKINALEITGFIGICAHYIAVYFAEELDVVLMCIVGVFMAEMLIYVVAFPKFNAQQVMTAFFSFMYAPVMLSFVYLTRASSQGLFMVWMILISSWGCDTCAYVVGKLFGKRRIFPVLSPKKSLEGCIGGVLGAALLGALYGNFVVKTAVSDSRVAGIVAFICAVGAIMSMAGDLGASAIKRNNNIKDYGKLIPGHGGVMDRFDSMIVTAPMIYFLTVLMIRL